MWSPPGPSLLTTFQELLRAQQRFLLTGHENPDGDCLGAEAALYHLLKALGKQVVICNPDPIGKAHDFLLQHTPFGHVRGDQPLPPFDVAVLLDCSQLSRVGHIGERLRASGKTIAVIDHHIGSDAGDGTVCYVDPKAAATGALVRRLYRLFDVPLNAAAAEGIFLSLVSDTGWFRTRTRMPKCSRWRANWSPRASTAVPSTIASTAAITRIARRCSPTRCRGTGCAVVGGSRW